ncbi:MAG: hypothetical protein PWP24_349 [Clostridiales bacterium]|nr:hypothetical protein [Clostridiales bacterium]
MEIITGISIALAVYFGWRLFLLKRALARLEKDAKAVKQEMKQVDYAQRNLVISLPDKQLERLALLMNDFIDQYVQDVSLQKKNIALLKNEITILSHDLRTPLTSILGYINLLDQEALTRDQKEVFEVISRKGVQLNELVEQLYEYARLGNLEYRFHWETIDLYRFLKEHLLNTYLEFEAKNLELVTSFPSEHAPIYIKADKMALQRVLSNLTSNAIKYANGYAKVALEKNNRYATLIFCTSRGELTEYDIAHLFDRYYQKSDGENQKGSSGLGLTITKMFVEQMKGTMEVRADERNLFITCRFQVRADVS